MHNQVGRIEVLSSSHDRDEFDCGEESLNSYLKRQAGQDLRRGIGVTHAAIAAADESRILGYYTLAMGSVRPEVMPEKGLPTRVDLPVVLLGRLAVDISCKGTGLGEYLLMDALARSQRIAESEIGAVAVVVDAFPQARRFYEKYGFQRLLDDELHLYLSMKTIRRLELNG